jgi:5'-nucleotidase
MNMSFIRSLLTVSGAVVLLSACATGSASFTPVTINMAHINDHHSQLEPLANAELKVGGQPTRMSLGGFARVTAAMREMEKSTPNLLKLHAGDAITGTLYYTFFKGQADARLMNTVCFDAFALGNHEFDDSDNTLKGFLNELAQGDCKTPVLSANVKPAAGTPIAGVVQPYTVKTIGGVKVGIVGLTIADKTTNSSRPLDSTKFTNEAQAAQASIDALRSQGIYHIVLLTHQGYERDVALAAQLTDVDAIIGGDSHSLLGDFTSLGLKSSGAYPTVVKNRNGETVCVGQAWEYVKAIGLMSVQFDAQGRVAQCGGRAQLLVGDDYARKAADGQWVSLPAAERDALTASLRQSGAVRVSAPDAQAAQVLASYTAQVDEQKKRSVGALSDALCLVRVPGEATNRSASVAGCEKANTLARGSDAAQAVAEAFLSAAKRADLALQNAGGVRIAMPAGAVNMNTAVSMLPFTNVLVELSMTGAEIHAALEDAASNHLDNKSSDGSHPYAAGLRWNLDMSRAKGQRFSALQLKNRSTGVWEDINPQRNYVVVTNDFIASGKDGYTTLGQVSQAGRIVNTYLLYTQSFVDHLGQRNPYSRPARADYSHQSVLNAKGEKLVD